VFLPHIAGSHGAAPTALIGITRQRFARVLAPRARELFDPTLRHGASLRLDDIGADPRFTGPISAEGVVVRSFLAMPVVSRAGEILGGMFLAHERAGAFSRRHESTLAGLASQAAIALDNARLYEAERAARTAVERAVASLELNDQRLQLALRAGRMGIWHWDVATDRVTCSDQVERIFALESSAPLTRESFLGLVHEEDRAAVADAFARALQLRGEFLAEFRIPAPDGAARWIAHKGQVFCDAAGQPMRLSGVCMDVTARKRVEQALADQARALSESNAELEQFAYVASHDLQEPLRMVTSYLALLKRRSQENLDERAQQYLAFAVDGAQRMMALISDLLLYSRAGRVGERPVEPVASEPAVVEAIGNLGRSIADSSAVISRHDLPPVRAQHLHLVQLFQNLIGNALKFRGDRPAEIDVWAERAGGEWVFHVRDNGIGIAPEHHARIFEVFQRLHARGRYSGTGIGLAIAKKIVDRVGGRIWVDSAEGRGATFSFTVPD
jgi:PAS domain S-box-containing protein